MERNLVGKATLKFSPSFLNKAAQNPGKKLVWSSERASVHVLEDPITHLNQIQSRNDPDNVQERLAVAKDILGFKLVSWQNPDGRHKFVQALKVCFTEDIKNYLDPCSIHVTMTRFPKSDQVPRQAKLFVLDIKKAQGSCWIEDMVFGPEEGFYCKRLGPEVTYVVLLHFRPRKWGPVSISAMNPCAKEAATLRSKFESMAKYETIDHEKASHFCDVKIKTNTGLIPCNSFLLTIRSEVFAAMFTHSTAEAASKILTIEDFDHGTISKMIQYLYGTNLDDKDYDKKLLQIADKYNIIRLKLDCEWRFAEALNVNNVVKFWILSHQCQADNLKEYIVSFLKKNWSMKNKIKDLQSTLVTHPSLINDIFAFI